MFVVSQTDYLAYGQAMPDRSFNTTAIRYTFNGKEDEIFSEWQDYGFRNYDKKQRRFTSVDSLTAKYPWYTPYQFAGNKVIQAVDLDGAEELVTNDGKFVIANGPYRKEHIQSLNQKYVEKRLLLHSFGHVDSEIDEKIETLGYYQRPYSFKFDKLARELFSKQYATGTHYYLQEDRLRDGLGKFGNCFRAMENQLAIDGLAYSGFFFMKPYNVQSDNGKTMPTHNYWNGIDIINHLSSEFSAGRKVPIGLYVIGTGDPQMESVRTDNPDKSSNHWVTASNMGFAIKNGEANFFIEFIDNGKSSKEEHIGRLYMYIDKENNTMSFSSNYFTVGNLKHQFIQLTSILKTTKTNEKKQ